MALINDYDADLWLPSAGVQLRAHFMSTRFWRFWTLCWWSVLEAIVIARTARIVSFSM